MESSLQCSWCVKTPCPGRRSRNREQSCDRLPGEHFIPSDLVFCAGDTQLKCCRLSSFVQRCLLTVRPGAPRFLLFIGGMTLQRDAKCFPSRHPLCMCCSLPLFLALVIQLKKKKKRLFNRRRVSKHVGYCYLFPVCCSLSYSCSLLYTAGSTALSKRSVVEN